MKNNLLYINMINSALRSSIVEKRRIARIALWSMFFIVLSCSSSNEEDFEMKESQNFKNPLSEPITSKSIGKDPNDLTNKFYNAELEVKAYISKVEAYIEILAEIQGYGLELYIKYIIGDRKNINKEIESLKELLNSKNFDQNKCKVCNKQQIIHGEHIWVYNQSGGYIQGCNNCYLKNQKNNKSLSTLRTDTLFPTALVIPFERIFSLTDKGKEKILFIKLCSFHLNNLNECYLKLIKTLEASLQKTQKLHTSKISEDEENRTPVVGTILSFFSSHFGDMKKSEEGVENLKQRLNTCRSYSRDLNDLSSMLYIYDIYIGFEIEYGSYIFGTKATLDFLRKLKASKLYDLEQLYPEKSKALRAILLIFSLLNDPKNPTTTNNTIAEHINKRSSRIWIIDSILNIPTIYNPSPNLNPLNGNINNIFSIIDALCNPDFEKEHLLTIYDPSKVQILYTLMKGDKEAIVDFMRNFAFAIKPNTMLHDFQDLVIAYLSSKEEVRKVIIKNKEELNNFKIKFITELLKAPSAILADKIIKDKSLEQLDEEHLKVVYKLAGMNLDLFSSEKASQIRESMQNAKANQGIIPITTGTEYSMYESKENKYPNLTALLESITEKSEYYEKGESQEEYHANGHGNTNASYYSFSNVNVIKPEMRTSEKSKESKEKLSIRLSENQ